MKIVVLSRGPHLYSTQSIVRAARRKGHYVVVIDHMYCDLVNEKGEIEIFYEGRKIKGVSAIIPRIGSSATSYGALVIRHFQHRGVYSTVKPEALLKARNKFASLQILAFNGVQVPKSILSSKAYQLDELFDELRDPPYIIKMLKSTHGLGVLKGDTKDQAIQLVEAFSNMKQKFLMQEFIEESKGTDIRAFVVGGKVVASMKRTAPEGEFRSNLHRGGRGIPVSLSEEEERTAIRSAELMGLSIAGVDMLQSSRGPLILEVNSSPGLEGIEKTTGKDIASTVINYVAKAVAERKQSPSKRRKIKRNA